MSNPIPAQAELPETFLQRLQQIIPVEHFDTCLRSFSTPRDVAFRVNTLVADVDDVLAGLHALGISAEPIPWLDVAFTVRHEQRATLLATDAFAKAEIYVQNPSSMLACMVLDPQPGETILDLAAAPGGKTLMIAAMMNNQGSISAVEPIRKRFYKLNDNLRKHGVTIVKTYLKDGRTVGSKTPERFDRVLLDAPCSGEARFRTDDPDSWKYWSERKIREQSRKQIGLLKSAMRALKPGGTLVYCTCSFAAEENERCISKTIRRFGDTMRVAEVELPRSVQTYVMSEWQGERFADFQLGRRIVPDQLLDGFFISRIEKLGGSVQPFRDLRTIVTSSQTLARRASEGIRVRPRLCALKLRFLSTGGAAQP